MDNLPIKSQNIQVNYPDFCLQNANEINDFIIAHQRNFIEFNDQMVRRLIEKITSFYKYSKFPSKDSEERKVKMQIERLRTQQFELSAVFIGKSI